VGECRARGNEAASFPLEDFAIGMNQFSLCIQPLIQRRLTASIRVGADRGGRPIVKALARTCLDHIAAHDPTLCAGECGS